MTAEMNGAMVPALGVTGTTLPPATAIVLRATTLRGVAVISAATAAEAVAMTAGAGATAADECLLQHLLVAPPALRFS